MREIKFRAWHKEKECMFDDVKIGESLNTCFESNNVILMQFIGLQDSTGIDIYDGDILAILTDSGPILHLVEFTTGIHYNGWNLTHLDLENHALLIGNIYLTPELLEKINP